MRAALWVVALCCSLLVHAGIAGLFLATDQPAAGSAHDEGEGGVDIGLGMAGTYSDLAAAKDQTPTPAEPVKTDMPTPPPPEAPDTVATSDDIEAVEAENSNRNLVPKKPVLPAQKPATKAPVSTPAPTPAQTTDAAEKQPSEPDNALPVSTQAASVAATGSANSNRSGASKGDVHHYFGEIMSWLSKYKRYPVALKKKKKQGVVTVEFSIDRNGYLLAARVSEGSGYPQLDEAALEMLHSASPLPAMPDWMDKQSLTLSIPVEYSLITNSSFKE